MPEHWQYHVQHQHRLTQLHVPLLLSPAFPFAFAACRHNKFKLVTCKMLWPSFNAVTLTTAWNRTPDNTQTQTHTQFRTLRSRAIKTFQLAPASFVCHIPVAARRSTNLTPILIPPLTPSFHSLVSPGAKQQEEQTVGAKAHTAGAATTSHETEPGQATWLVSREVLEHDQHGQAGQSRRHGWCGLIQWDTRQQRPLQSPLRGSHTAVALQGKQQLHTLN